MLSNQHIQRLLALSPLNTTGGRSVFPHLELFRAGGRLMALIYCSLFAFPKLGSPKLVGIEPGE
jgi:hypothetical protein